MKSSQRGHALSAPRLRENDSRAFLDAPYFRVESGPDGVRTSGQECASLGHRVRGGEDGVFAEWSWDGRELVLRNDRLGMYPVFYHGDGDRLIVSTSVFKILAEGVAPRVDWPALAVFLRTGFFVAEDTSFEGLRALPPDATLRWQPGHLSVQGRYWFPETRRPARDAAVGDYVDIFRAAISSRIPDRAFAVPLSGGRDSRHILLELCAQGRKPDFCITGRRFPPARTEDETVARNVAEAAGVLHLIVGPPPSQVASFVEANFLTNMTAPRRGWKLAIVEKLEQSVDVSFDGIGGDMLSGGSALDAKKAALLERGQLREFCRKVFDVSEATLRRMIPRAQMDRMTDHVATERLLPEVEKHLSAANPTTSFYFWNRTRRFDSSNPYGMFAGIPTVYAPFLDHALFAHLSSLPSDFNLGGWLHDEAIARAYPRFANLPYEIRGALVGNRGHSLRTTVELARYFKGIRPSRLLRPDYYVPRLLLRTLTMGLGSSGSWDLHNLILLGQLESILKFGV
jgi:hypothetical protein